MEAETSKTSLYKEALERKKTGYRHIFFEINKTLLLAIEDNDLRLLHECIEKQVTWPLPKRMSRNEQIQNDRANAIRHIDTAMRCAITYYVDYELVNCIGEIAIGNINSGTTRKDIFTSLGIALEVFADLIAETKKKHYSVQVTRCIRYIDEHLYKKMSVAQIASAQDLNPDYLSRLFKKETSFVLSNYIVERKIREAKLLLSNTNYSIIDIATMLSFNHLSHFCGTFKKITHMTPSQFAKSSKQDETKLNVI
jgi:AraC-like DNA-binding protein